MGRRSARDAPGPDRRELRWPGSSLVLAWSPDGRKIATGDQDASVHFWDVRSGRDLMMSGYPRRLAVYLGRLAFTGRDGADDARVPRRAALRRRDLGAGALADPLAVYYRDAAVTGLVWCPRGVVAAHADGAVVRREAVAL